MAYDDSIIIPGIITKKIAYYTYKAKIGESGNTEYFVTATLSESLKIDFRKSKTTLSKGDTVKLDINKKCPSHATIIQKV